MTPSDSEACWPGTTVRVAAIQTFEAQVVTNWDSARPDWEAALRGGVATPFQATTVVDAWYRAMSIRPEIEPVIVTLRDGATGAHAMSLALIRTRYGSRAAIGFADLGLIDYNAPVLGPAAPASREGAVALWRTLRRALPKADLIDLRKMPETIGHKPNPFALLGTSPCAMNGNVVRTGDSWADYHAGLKRTVRKELERSWRVFTRYPGAEFRAITDPVERRRVLAAIETQQPQRMEATGKSYVLDAPSAASFYQNLVAARDDQVILTALTCGEDVVAALLGLHDRNEYIMVRISNQDGEWANASPGKLIIDRSMEWLHGQGHRHFDFSIGNYDYKRRFGVEPIALIDLVQPLGWRGLPAATVKRLRNFVRRSPALHKFARRVLRRP